MLKKNYAVLKKGNVITTKLPLGTVFGVLGPLNRTSHINSLGALSGPKGEDHDSCTPRDGVTHVYCSSHRFGVKY